MKVYQITEAKTIIKKGPLQGFSFDTLDDGQIKITAPDGKTSIASNRYAAEIRAKEMLPGVKTPTPTTDQPKNDAPKVRPEPPLDTPTDPDELKAGVKPGTPTSDSLSRSQQRKLSRHGKIKVNGQSYTRAQIAAADAEADRIRNSQAGKDVRPGDDKTKSSSGDKNPKPDADSTPPGFVRRIWNKIWGVVRTIIGPAGANAINGAINISAIEDSLDSYLRALRDYARGLESDADRQRFLSNMENNNPPSSIAGAYVQLVERISQLIIEAIVGILVGGLSAAVAIKLLALAGLSTGVIGIILSVIAGGIFAIAGTKGVYELLELSGMNDWVENQLAKRFFTPGALFDAARAVDGAQEFFGAAFDWIGAGDVIRDSIYNETSDKVKLQTIDSKAAERNLKKLIKSNPELMQAYQDGKEEAKQLIRSASE